MRYVQFGLLCEGSTDWAVLPALLEKAIQALLAEDEVHDHFEWQIAPAGLPSDDQIAKTVSTATYDVVLVHRDGASRAEAVRTRIHEHGAVPVVPVREMEAWLIVEPEAFARAANVSADRLSAKLPRGAAVEEISDPKAVMQEILESCFRRPPRGARSDDLEWYLEIVAAQVNLEALRQLDAFRRTLVDLRKALAAMGWPFRQSG